ncbi:MAG: hypothetical protein WC307_00125 [Candidatus Nanoarchaeia archaeon]
MLDKDRLVMISLGGAICINILLLGFPKITGYASYEEGQTTASATVPDYVDVSLSDPSPEWTSINPGSINATADTNPTMTINSATGTNVASDIYIYCGDFTDGGENTFLGANMTLERASTLNFTCAAAYDTTTKVADLDCPCGGAAQTTTIDWLLSVPSGQAAAAYSSTVKICLTKDGTSISGTTCS